MKTFRITTSPFKQRVWYEDKEIEHICSESLRKSDLFPQTPSPIRIERFIEKRFGLIPEFVDLKQYGVLGVTLFGHQGPSRMLVSKELDKEDLFTKRRYQSTLAHEAGHCLLHGYLFAMSARKSGNTFLCREHQVASNKYKGEWWEYQANATIGALLLPHFLLKSHLKDAGIFSLDRVTDDLRLSIAATFDVNLSVVNIRLAKWIFS